MLRILPTDKKPYGRNGGFTLVELSIVLVIIGLVVGGVLVGRDLIHAAEIRAQVSQFEKFNTAVKTFRLKYNGLPGDITLEQVTGFGFPNQGGNYGNGDNLLKDNSGYMPGASLWVEPYFFFIHLSEASLIEGKYYMLANHYVIGEQFPPAKIGKSGIFAYSLATGKLAYFLGMDTNSTTGPNDIATFSTAGVINPYDAYMLDSKTDDGIPTSGRIRSATITALVPAYDVSDGACSTASTSSYNITSSVIACRLIVTAD